MRFGYLTALDGFGLPAGGLHADLTVLVPPGSAVPPTGNPPAGDTLSVVGVMENFAWAGGIEDPLNFDFYVSQQNATQVKTLQQLALKTTAVQALNFWIADFDPETNQWYSAAYPQHSLSGILVNKDNPELNVDLTPVPAGDGIGINVYKITMAIAPGGKQQYSLTMANSSTQQTTKPWGIVIGSIATMFPSPP
jgi:hypothetical protein